MFVGAFLASARVQCTPNRKSSHCKENNATNLTANPTFVAKLWTPLQNSTLNPTKLHALNRSYPLQTPPRICSCACSALWTISSTCEPTLDCVVVVYLHVFEYKVLSRVILGFECCFSGIANIFYHPLFANRFHRTLSANLFHHTLFVNLQNCCIAPCMGIYKFIPLHLVCEPTKSFHCTLFVNLFHCTIFVNL